MNGRPQLRCGCDDPWSSIPSLTIKYRIFGHPRLLLRGWAGAHTELTLAVMAYNLKRMANVLGNTRLTLALQKN
jgi:IS5 family transposase